jgi:hypothetical protein
MMISARPSSFAIALAMLCQQRIHGFRQLAGGRRPEPGESISEIDGPAPRFLFAATLEWVKLSATT